jgi:small subunit ribosomal protein S2
MAVVPMKALLESGVHFGHRTHKWNPSMKPYIFTERNGIHIIDLQKTSKALDQAYNVVRDLVANGGNVLFVGTKRQAQETIQLEATRCSMPYVTARWLGGMLTNWRTIRQRINELERLERMRDSGDFGRITKKEALILTREIERLEGLLTGVRKMARVPEMVFVVDVSREFTAIHEANLLKIPVVAMVDTNCDPSKVDYVIPSNDDAIRAIKLVVGRIAEAALEGLGLRKEEVVEEMPSYARLAGEERELTDEELLGEATLAKLSSQARDVVEVEEEAEEDIEVDTEEGTELDTEEDAEVDAEVDTEEDAEVDTEEDAEVDTEEDAEVDTEEDAEVDTEEDAEVDTESDVDESEASTEDLDESADDTEVEQE